MKTSKSRFGIKALMLLSVLSTPFAESLAYKDILIEETTNVLNTGDILNSDKIDIEGIYVEKKKPSQGDAMEKLRKELEEKNEQMVQRKIEQERIKAEKELAENLRDAFNGFGGEDKVHHRQGGVVKHKIEHDGHHHHKIRKNKVQIGSGFTAITGDRIDVESNMRIDLAFETQVHPHWSVGFGVNYLSMDAIDIGRSSYYYGNDVNYSKYGIEFQGKYIFVNHSVFRPYMGLGLGYNRSKAKYENSAGMYGSAYSSPYYNNYNAYYSPYNNSQYQYGEDGFSSSYVNGTILAGSDFIFARRYGVNLEMKYSKALTNGYDKDAGAYGVSQDEGDLRNITGQIEEADHFSINVGLLFKF